MLTLKRRGKVFYVRGQFQGRTIFKSLDTPRRDVAELLLAKLEREMAAGPIAKITWADFQPEFLTWSSPNLKPSSEKKYTFVLTRFARFLDGQGITSLREIAPSHISMYMTERVTDPLHPKRNIPVGREGLKSDLRILRGCFSYAIRCGYLNDNPVKVPRLNTTAGKTMPYTREEIGRILADPWMHEHPELRAVVLAFLYTGLRISDIVAFRKDAVDWREQTIRVRTQKRQKFVSIPLHPVLEQGLRLHLAGVNKLQQASPLMFPTSEGRTNRSMDALLRRMFKRVGIAGGRAHRFRDTFAVFMLEAGATLYDVSKLLGITMAVAERCYAPYTKELADRGRRILGEARFQLLTPA